MERPVRRFLLGTAFWMTTCGGAAVQADAPEAGVARAPRVETSEAPPARVEPTLARIRLTADPRP